MMKEEGRISRVISREKIKSLKKEACPHLSADVCLT